MAKFYFIKKIIISLGISCLSLVTIVALAYRATDLEQEIGSLQHRLLSLNQLAIRSQEAEALIKAHHEDFAAFEACEFERPLTSETLQNALSHTIEFGHRSALNGDPRNKGLISQEVSFLIPCLQDRDIFALLDHLINRGPGIFQIHDVTIGRVSPLSEEMLEKIAAGKPQTLFDGRITATWTHR